MKQTFLLVIFACFALAARAQDIVSLTSGSQMQAKVMEINPDNVRYKDYNNQDGPMVTVKKKDVASIRYANGTTTVFNDPAAPGGKDNKEAGFRKKPRTNAPLHRGWYFGAGVTYGVTNIGNQDPAYTISAGLAIGLDLLATKMFNQHIGIQMGLAENICTYFINPGGGYGIVPGDGFTVKYVSVPVRVLYLSNSKKRVGVYVSAGADFSILASATDQERDNLSGYYSQAQIMPYLSCGVDLRSRNGHGVWLLGPYYETTVSNFYSGNTGNSGNNWITTGNTGNLHAIGISAVYMMRFGKR